MSEETFWVMIWGMVLTSVTAIAFMIYTYNTAFDNKLVELINSNTDPIAVRCALSPPRDTSVCLTYVMQEGNNARNTKSD